MSDLDVSRSEEEELSEGSSDEEGVYDLSEDDEDQSEDEEVDEDEDSDDEAEHGGRLGQLARQEKALRLKAALQDGTGSSEEEEDAEEERGWGANKRAYYDIRKGDEEEAEEEAEEAQRMQAEALTRLRNEDFGVQSDSGDDEDGGPSGDDGRVEVVTTGPRVFEREDKLAVVQQDAPELLGLLGELQKNLLEVRACIGPLLKEVRGGELATSEGVSYLEAKHLLLLSYCTNIVFYVLLKAEGRPVRDHPVIARLVQLRLYLDKMRPIDAKLKYQIDKLLMAAQEVQAATGGGARGNEEADGEAGQPQLAYAPRPDRLVAREAEDGDGAGAGRAEAGANGVYRPPKLNAVSMDFDQAEDRAAAREKARQREAGRRGARSSMVAELAREIQGAPEELREAAPGMDSVDAQRLKRRLAARSEVEEDLMLRVPLSKEERRRLKAQQRAGLAGRGALDDFAEEVADLVQAAERMGGGGADLAALRGLQTGGPSRGGDDDLPMRDPLHDRRAKFDNKRAGMDMDAEEEPRKRKARAVEDELYQEAARAAKEKKQAKEQAYAAPATLPPLAEEQADGARKINRAIESNRGLTAHRRKDMKNPRKKNRLMYEKATKRRRGQVQEVKSGGSGYGGEATGIRKSIAKSVRF